MIRSIVSKKNLSINIIKVNKLIIHTRTVQEYDACCIIFFDADNDCEKVYISVTGD